MEYSALTRAHEHVRTAATATYDNRVATAGQEHDFAAAAFDEAVQDTHNAEALRILALLQDHHRKLAGLIKEAPRKEKLASTSNLAEKRGIPTARRTTGGTAVNVAGAIGSRSEEQGATPVRDLLAQQARKVDSTKLSDSSTLQKENPTTPPARPPAEDNFRRFYSAFGGVISAISAPLAFTSLPLNPTPPTPPPAAPPRETKPSKAKSRTHSPEASRTVKSSVPDLAALISKPALRALREDGTAPLGPNESFYLVPGTASYASILSHKLDSTTTTGPLPSIDESPSPLKGSSHEEFVDARENVGPPSPTKARRAPSSSSNTPGVTPQRSIPAGRGMGLKTLEELALENETLKSLVDNQAKRIQMWETNSQNSFNALAQSMRARGTSRDRQIPTSPTSLMGPGSGPGSGSGTGVVNSSQPASPGLGDADTARKVAHLEALLARQNAKVDDLMANNDQLARQNEKNAQVIARYREQWEKLKAGARKKEVERREKRAQEIKAGEKARDSESGETEADVEAEVEEPGFGKA
ncbi:hypothetical protein GQ44DRAFT_753090 [Phaeosphaeriaceae sp. PMI808]|nr:hypothetical protein GQ44DRAFT_753090 [Phaeosphaeriaceae sp. PMI808]